MTQTYKARLMNNRLEWQGEKPDSLKQNQPVEIIVTIVGEAGEEQAVDQIEKKGELMAKLLEQLSQLEIRSIDDPLSWERKQRQDRLLPLRDDPSTTP